MKALFVSAIFLCISNLSHASTNGDVYRALLDAIRGKNIACMDDGTRKAVSISIGYSVIQIENFNFHLKDQDEVVLTLLRESDPTVRIDNYFRRNELSSEPKADLKEGDKLHSAFFVLDSTQRSVMGLYFRRSQVTVTNNGTLVNPDYRMNWVTTQNVTCKLN